MFTTVRSTLITLAVLASGCFVLGEAHSRIVLHLDGATKQHFAVGGCELKAIPADDRTHLRQIYTNFIGYGYAEKLPSKKMYINDPWSDLPSSFQKELELLTA